MSRRDKYPRVRGVTPLAGMIGYQGPHECAACASRATASIRVSFTHMRGEDECYFVCDRHQQIARDSLSKFLAHVGSKARFVARSLPPVSDSEDMGSAN